MKKTTHLFNLLLLALFVLGGSCTGGGGSGEGKPTQPVDPSGNRSLPFNSIPESFYAQGTEPDEIKIGTYNLHNFFNWTHEHSDYLSEASDDPNHLIDDLAYLPKNDPLFQSARFIAKYERAGKEVYCESLRKRFYREQCLRIDWTEAQARLKASQLAEGIRKMGDLPDILAVQEVEGARNKEVYANQDHIPALELLRAELGYTGFELATGMDRRPIQVGLLYNDAKLTKMSALEISPTVEYISTNFQNAERRQNLLEAFEKVEGEFSRKSTRNILNVTFLVNGTNKMLSVFVNHWPSQGATTDKRMFMGLLLKAVIDEQYENLSVNMATNDIYAVALGDFNMLAEEKYNSADEETELKGSPLHNLLADPRCNELEGVDSPACLQDVQDHLIYLGKKRINGLSNDLKYDLLPKFPNGTYWYAFNNEWNRLDRILLSRNAFRSVESYRRNHEYLEGDALKVLPRSFRIVAPGSLFTVAQTSSWGMKASEDFFSWVKTWIPFGSDPTQSNAREAGYSDHLGVYFKLKVYP